VAGSLGKAATPSSTSSNTPSNGFTFSVWFKDFVAGTFGGVAGIVAGQPMDTIRVPCCLIGWRVSWLIFF